ncbi:V-type ATP synthase subunit I [Methanoplanus limicola]|uniref:A-type ATP synthase subunit I n=1 Tax=Methanoplanus limicola DSM 2279 TaxID=937775 RepID=H1YZF3_9EURY|nr:V-type ATP synthase subunit I [Methanoplanus limicola]EHQ36062.1 V-type ATPase 116 kDa subunit [Methanoplanus limicola DSM 2279]
MLTPAEMSRLTLVIHKKSEEKLISALHESGLIEITDIADAPDDLKELLEGEQRRPDKQITELKSFLERSIEALKEEPLGSIGEIMAFFSPPKRQKADLRQRTPDETKDDIEKLRPEILRAIALRTESEEIREEKGRLKDERELLTLLNPFDFDLGYLGRSEFLSVKAGFFEEDEADLLITELKSKEIDGYILRKTETGGGHVIAIASLLHCSDEVERALKKFSFREFSMGFESGKPAEAIAVIDRNIKLLEERSAEIKTEQAELKEKYLPEFQVLHEELAVIKSRGEGLLLADSGKNLTVIRGFVPEKEKEKLKSLCDNASFGLSLCIFEKVDPESEEIPVLCTHHPAVRPFLMLTKLFSTPKYGEIDPTLFLAPVLVITFGIMLGDVGYGLLLVILSALILNGAGRDDGDLRDLSLTLVACGFSGMFFGFFEGGFFGDLLPKFAGVNYTSGIIDPLADPILMLVIALIFGILHLNAGLILGAWKNLSAGNRSGILKEQGVWFLLQPCAAVLLFSFFGWAEFDQSVKTAAIAGTFVAVAAIMLFEGPLGFFSLTGFLGDWLSYSRILALALATGGIAMTINIITGMMAGIGGIVVIAAAVFCVAGHMVNFILQVLGGFIHSLRLQYVEFFGKFYVGGGESFKPFTYKRFYTGQKGDLK